MYFAMAVCKLVWGLSQRVGNCTMRLLNIFLELATVWGGSKPMSVSSVSTLRAVATSIPSTVSATLWTFFSNFYLPSAGNRSGTRCSHMWLTSLIITVGRWSSMIIQRGTSPTWHCRGSSLTPHVRIAKIPDSMKASARQPRGGKFLPNTSTICHNFNHGKCTTTPCSFHRQHECAKCGSMMHGASACTAWAVGRTGPAFLPVLTVRTILVPLCQWLPSSPWDPYIMDMKYSCPLAPMDSVGHGSTTDPSSPTHRVSMFGHTINYQVFQTEVTRIGCWILTHHDHR